MRTLDDPDILRSILESIQTGVYFVGRDQRIQFWNEGAERITGYLRQDVIGHFCRDFFPPQDEAETTRVCAIGGGLANVLRDGKPACSDVSIRHREGHQVLLRVRAVPIRGSDGAIVGAAESFDETRWAHDPERRQNKLEEYGCLDETTGVLSAAYIHTHLRECLATFRQHRLPFSIAAVRIAGLAQLRAKYGPIALKEVLHVVAQTVSSGFRPTDFIGRSDSEGFLAVLPECNPLDAERVCLRVRALLQSVNVRWWGDEFSVQAAIAVATVEPSDDVESLLARVEGRLTASTPHREAGTTKSLS